MKNKILINLLIPDIEKSYDIYIPLNKTVGNIVVLLSKMIKELNNELPINYEGSRLYNAETALTYDPQKTIKETNIRNASKLIMM